MNDVTKPEKVIAISIARKGSERTLWVNVDEKCELRISCIDDNVRVENEVYTSWNTGAYHLIRPNIIDALRAYADERRPVGGFLTAFLSNDLMEAIGLADTDNITVIPQIAGYIHNELPRVCHGSIKAVKEWLA